jgi:hypothetical protein
MWVVVFDHEATVESACGTTLPAATEELVKMLDTSSAARSIKGRREAPRSVSEFAGLCTNER